MNSCSLWSIQHLLIRSLGLGRRTVPGIARGNLAGPISKRARARQAGWRRLAWVATVHASVDLYTALLDELGIFRPLAQGELLELRHRSRRQRYLAAVEQSLFHLWVIQYLDRYSV